MRRLLTLFSLLSLLAIAIMPSIAQDDVATVRVAHFSPDAPAVDVYVNDEVAIEALEFTEVTSFIELPADTYSVAVAPAGTSLDDAVIGSVDLTLEADDAITVAAVGSVEDGTLTATIVAEDYSPIDSGSARITFLHTIENESALDLVGSSILLVQAVRYPDGSGDGAFTRDVPAGRYNFEANIAESDTTVRVGNGVEIEDGQYYLIVALGPQANEGELLIITPEGLSLDEDEMMGDDTDMSDEEDMDDDSEEMSDEEDMDEPMAMLEEGTAMIRVAHFSPDAPAVDIYVNGEVAVAGLEFPEVTPFLGLAGDTYSVAVAPADTSIDDAVIGPVDITIEDDTNTTVAAIGSLDDETLSATVFTEDFSPLGAGQARITFVNVIENESALDLVGSSILLVQAVRYPDGSSDGAFTRDVPAGRYNFEANIAESDTTIRVANGVEIEDGSYTMIVALGPQANEGELLIVSPEGFENPDDE
ncbi:MAG: DUF4397 domain-containing protein [Chloroflexota bacterium]